jgi:hypothetical protein
MPATNQITPQQQNILARQAVIRQAVDMKLPIYSQSFTAANSQGPGTVINIPPRNVGLLKRFIIEVSGSITAASALTRTPNGGANFFSQVQFTDLSNQQRVSTTGWHLVAVSTAKRRRPYGAAAALDEPSPAHPGIREPFGYGYGNQSDVVYCPPTIAANDTFQLFFEVPISYTDHDLRGCIYANVTNATMNLQLTINPQLFTVTGSPGVARGMYSGAANAGTLTGFKITIHQHFLDQLPIAQQGGAVLPLLDMSTAYLLNNTAVSGIVINQDNPIPFANFRDFMSSIVIMDDAGAYTMPAPFNYFALQSANYTNIFKYDQPTNGLLSRLIIGDDFPIGLNYFDYRDKPVSTIQYGNMETIIQPNALTNPNAAFLVGFESLALINMITQAGSLYGS